MSSGLVDPNDPPLPEVERRAAVLRDLLRQSGWKVTAEVADAALAQLGIPRSTLFRGLWCKDRKQGIFDDPATLR
jgi:hypothetical protein